VLANKHYKYFYTTHFGLDDSFYSNKTILDIGCGPRGSLEWATTALRRVGLDPLAKEYLRLGADKHQMEYVDAPSEKIPMKDAECDVVTSFNSLDHVKSIERSLAEIKRVTRAGGLFLLMVEVNHPPTSCEPHQLSPENLIEALAPEFMCETFQTYKIVPGGMYDSIYANEKLLPEEKGKAGYFSARFTRMAVA
jgi:ubiquinone/menaquinone biosynthesis C-methylase UbiE